MNSREWLRDRIEAAVSSLDIARKRIIQGESILQVHELDRPFLVYIFGNKTNEDLFEDSDAPVLSRQFFSIYIHDRPADYGLIDDVELALIRGLHGQGNNSTLTIRYLETSRDLDDQTLGTIMRYVRFQMIRADKKEQ